MSRRASRQADKPASKENLEETIVSPTSKAQRGRKAVLVKFEEKVVTTSTGANIKSSKQQKVKAEISDNKIHQEPEVSPPKRKINSVKGKAFLEETEAQKTPAKRKAKKEEDEDEVDNTKTKKKRKTKEEKEAEAMPIATRTSVATLKKAMRIGAHVSGAGGKYSLKCLARNVLIFLLKVYKTRSTMLSTLGVTRSPYFSNPNENGRARRWLRRLAISSKHSVWNTNMTQQNMSCHMDRT